MKFTVLASGSKGNCTYVEKEKTKILIDLGMSSRYIENSLKEIGTKPNDIDAILITHTHTDHIKGLDTFIKKYKTPVYITKEMELDMSRYTNIEKFKYFNNKIKDIEYKTINLSHDSDDIVGFIIEDSLVYITDTGYININHFDDIQNKHSYIFESNYDVELLMNGKYPFFLQQRILSDKGHLSNRDSAYYLSRVIGKKTKNIILAHLSDNNNTEELAYDTLLSIFKKKKIKIENIVLAKQKERTEIFEIGE